MPVDGDEGSNKEYLDHIRSTGTPVVCVDREIEGIHCDGVYIDNYTACYEVTKDVLSRGYRNIAYMADPPIYRPGCDRLRGFRDACKEFGVTVPQENIFLAPIEDTKPLNAFCMTLPVGMSRRRRSSTLCAAGIILCCKRCILQDCACRRTCT